MRNIEWNEGMSVGVASIDNEHKTLLLLMREVNESINRRSSDAIIKGIFEKLEDYIKQHFSNEESLLQQCNYRNLDDHKKQHQKFVRKIPQLKKQLLNADTIDVAQEVSLFLLNWLMNHIVVEDMSYAKKMHDHGLSTDPPQAKSFIKRLHGWLGLKVELNKRISLNALVPLSGLIILSIAISWYSFVQYNNMQQLLGLTDIIRTTNTLIHSLQAERGLSTGYISSNYRDFTSALEDRRIATDVAAKAYQQTLAELPPKLINSEIFSHIGHREEWLVGLSVQRKTVDSRRSEIDNMQEYYTEFIDDLVSVFDAMLLLNIDAELSRNISAISAFASLKEATGQKRAIGALILGKGGFTTEEVQEIAQLDGRQEGLLKFFKHTATSQQKAKWVNFTNSKTFTETQHLEVLFYDAVTKGNLPTIDSDSWFVTLSSKIDQLELVIEQLVVDLEAKANQKTKNVQKVFFSITGILLIILLVTFAISWLLSQSIIWPVYHLAHAMTHLSHGHRDIRFTNDFANDEIGEMADAYEHARRSLLQADIYSSVRSERQTVNLEQKEREKEKYLQLASIDALTGAINRRKFNELAEQEVLRVKRYKRGLTVMMLDIDHFKKINDNYGHASGDYVLKKFYQTCHDEVRSTDIVARIGGEEFAILMPETKLQQAKDLAERVCIAVRNLTVTTDRTTIKLTVSIGVSAWEEGGENIEDMIEKADEALYKAKNTGRNRVITV